MRRLDAFLQEKWIALGAAAMRTPYERDEAGVMSQAGNRRSSWAGRRGERIEPELGIVGFARPAVMIFGTVADEQEQAGGRETCRPSYPADACVSPSIQCRFSTTKQRGLDLALPQQQMLDGVQERWRRCGRIEGLPLRVLDRHIQEHEEGRQDRLQGLAPVPGACR